MQWSTVEATSADLAVARTLDVHRRADQRQVREPLRVVAEQVAGVRIDLLREQADRRGECEQAFELALCSLQVAGMRQRVGKPERRHEERPLGPFEAVVGLLL